MELGVFAGCGMERAGLKVYPLELNPVHLVYHAPRTTKTLCYAFVLPNSTIRYQLAPNTIEAPMCVMGCDKRICGS